MKIFSFFGMLFSVILIGASIFNYFSLKDFLEIVPTAILYYILIPGFIGFFFLIFSLLVAKNYKWGNKHDFTPPPSSGSF